MFEDRTMFCGVAPRRAMIVSASVAALMVSAAHAQETTTSGPPTSEAATYDDGIKEITVTAQKRTERAQRVPISIQTLDAGALVTLGAGKLQDIEVAAPSLSFGDGSEQGRTGIRGVIDYSRNAGYDSRVGIYVDGVYYSRSWMNNQTLLGVAQVDVLRGPQGTLFGKNTDAGAIAITTVQPTRNVNGEAMAEIGNFGYLKAAVRSNMPLSDKLFIQLTGTHLFSNGYYKNTLLNRRNMGVNSDAARVQVKYDGSVAQLTLAADITDDQNSTLHYTYRPPAGTDIYSFRSYVHDYANRRTGGISGTVDADMGGGYDLTWITAWRSGHQVLNFNNETGVTPFLTALLEQKTDQFSEELRVASPRHDAYDFVAGLYYFGARNDDDYGSITGSGVRLFGQSYAGYANTTRHNYASVSTRNYAGFAQVNIRPLDKIEMFVGARLTHEQKTLNGITTNDPIGLFSIPLKGYTDKFSNTFFTPKAGVNLFARPNLMLFATIGQGFKSGGWNVEATSATAFAAGIRFRPETVTSYELGLKSDFLNRRARFNITGFYQMFKDFQVFTFVPTLVSGRTVLASSLSNVGVVSSTGIETELAVIPVRGLTLSANYTFNKSQFDSYPGGGGQVGSTLLNADGVQTPYAPEHKAYLAADVVSPLSGGIELTAHGGYSVQSSQNFDPKVVNPVFGSSYFIPGYDLADARIGLRAIDGGWNASLWMKNLADNDYIRFANRTALTGTSAILYGQPRSYGATVGFKF